MRYVQKMNNFRKESVHPSLLTSYRLLVQLPGDRWRVFLTLEAENLRLAALKAIVNYPGIRLPYTREQHDRFPHPLKPFCRTACFNRLSITTHPHSENRLKPKWRTFMSDRCFLITHDQQMPLPLDSDTSFSINLAFEPDKDPIPVLWMALFDESDITMLNTRKDFLDEEEEGEDPVRVEIPVLFSSVEKAGALLESRIPLIQKFIHPELWHFVEEFKHGVHDCGCTHIQFDTHAGCGDDSDLLKTFFVNTLKGFESESSWIESFGENRIQNTFYLYGLPFLSVPFSGKADLPWCHVAEDGSVKPSVPKQNQVSLGGKVYEIVDDNPFQKHRINEHFTLEHDEPQVVERFSTAFLRVWDAFDSSVKEELLSGWAEACLLRIPVANSKTKRGVYTGGKPYLGLLESFPINNAFSTDVGGGRGLLWCAQMAAAMDEEALTVFIGENLACALMHLRKQQIEESEYPEFVQRVARVDLSVLTAWLDVNRERMTDILKKRERDS
jgi:hypothetical protein